MVPRRPPEPLVAPLALPLPAGRVPLRDCWWTENGRRGFHDPEFELLDTGVFDLNRYWSVEVTYAKASPNDILMRINVENHGPSAEELHVLPTLWFRNTWSWDGDDADPTELAPERGCDPGRRDDRTSLRAGGRAGPDGPPVAAVLRERDQRAAPVRDRADDAVSQGRDQRPRRVRSRHGEPGPDRNEGGMVVPDDRPRRRSGRAAAALAPDRTAENGGASGEQRTGRRRVPCSGSSTRRS